MITYNMTASEDNKVIWFIRVTLDTFTIRACDNEFSDLVLSGNTWKHDVIKFNSISEINENIDVENGGNVGLLTNFEFEISRKVNDSNLTDFFNSLAPATSKPYITSRIVEVGVAWDTANLIDETDITWIHEFYIEDYSYDYSSMRLFCIEFAELEGKELPPYKVQNSFNDGISYSANPNEEVIGRVIPIVYGDFSALDRENYIYSLAPSVRLAKDYFFFKSACHKCDYVKGDYLYRYLQNADTVMELTGTTSGNSNVYAGHTVYLNTSSNISPIKGDLILKPKKYIPSYDTATFAVVTNVENAIDYDGSTFATIAVNDTVAFQLGTELSDSEFGTLDGTNADLKFVAKWRSSDSNTQNIRIQYYHAFVGASNGYSVTFVDDSTNATLKTTNYLFGKGTDNYISGSNVKKWDETDHWTINELQSLIYTVWNNSTSTADIELTSCYLQASDILIQGEVVIGYVVKEQRISGLGETKEIRAPKKEQRIVKISEDVIFASIKGKEFEGWIA